jgi:N-acetylmuramoyl-L-alanine amidase
MKPIVSPSPNFSSRGGTAVDTVVVHYTDMQTAEEAVARLCDVQAQVSAHYVIAEDGRVFALVDEQEKAWHAGASHWRGRDSVNVFSIGIELANTGLQYGYVPFPIAQMDALAELLDEIRSRHSIPDQNIAGHSDVAPTRKHDPGELFDWQWLAERGHGLWPEALPLSWDGDMQGVIARLSAYGYGITDESVSAVIRAFQQHFRPSLCNGIWDEACEGLLRALLQSVER